jgi:hypothetical protein
MTTLLLANETTKLPSDGKEIGYQDYVYDNDKETTTNKHQQQQYRSVFFRYMDGRVRRMCHVFVVVGCCCAAKDNRR